MADLVEHFCLIQKASEKEGAMRGTYALFSRDHGACSLSDSYQVPEGNVTAWPVIVMSKLLGYGDVSSRVIYKSNPWVIRKS